MNIKKLFALLAGVSLVAQTVVPSAGVFGATYSEELEGAYDWAYKNGVTTMSPIDNANMYGAITRAEMAKMLSVYAKDVLGKKLDSSKACEFTDIDSVKGDLHDYIIESCQLGIMGQGITEFRPYSTITRAEFGTALSRVLYGDVNNGGNPYYAKHLSALKADGIMTQIDNPTERDEIRGYVMLMLQRSDEGGAGVDCDDATIGLVCLKEAADGEYKDCPVACRDDDEDKNKEEEKDPEAGITYGEVVVSEVSFSETTAPSGIPGVIMGKIKIKAGDEDAKLTSITLKADGYGDYARLDSVYLEDEDGNRVTRQRNVDSDGNVTLDFVSNYELKANSSVTFSIANTINGAANGDTYGYTVTEVTGPEDVDGLPVSTDLVSVVRVSNLGKLEITANKATAAVKIGREEKLGSFKLAQSNGSQEDVRLYSIVVKQDGDVNMDDLSDLYISIAGEKVTSKAKVDGKFVTLTFDDGGYVIAKDKASSVTLNLMGTVTGSPAKSTRFVIEREEDIVAKGERHGYRVDIVQSTAPTTPWDLSDYDLSNSLNIEGSEIEVSFDKSEDLTVLATADSFSFGNLKLKASDTNYEFETLTLVLTTNTDFNPVSDLEAVVKNVKLGDMTAASITRKAANKYEYKFEGISMNKGVQRNLPLTMKLNKAASTETFKFDIDLSAAAFKLVDLDADKSYTTANPGDPVLNIMSTTAMTTNQVSVAGGSLKLTVNVMNDNQIVTENGKEIVVAKGKLEAGNNSDVKVTGIKFTNAGSASLSDFVSKAVLVVDGEKYNSTSIDATAGTIEFDREIEIEKGKRPEFELVLTLKKGNAASQTLSFKVNAAADVTAEDKEGNVIQGASKTVSTNLFGTFTLVSKGTLTADMIVDDDNSTTYTKFVNKDKYVVAGSEDVSLARVKFYADKEDVRIKNIKFNVNTNSADGLIKSLKDVRLVNGEDEYSASIAKNGGSDVTLTFKDIDSIIKQGSAQYLYLVADYYTIDPKSADGTAIAGVRAKVDDIVDDTDTRYIGVNSSLDIANPASTVVSKTTTVVANVPVQFTLVGEDNGNITSLGDYKLATLTIKMDAQTSNKNAQGEVLKATLDSLKATIGTSSGVAASYKIKKVGGSVAAQPLTNGTLTDVTGLLTDREIATNGTSFEIWATITDLGVRADGATFNVTIDPMNKATDVLIKDGSATPQTTLINLADGVSTRLNATTGK